MLAHAPMAACASGFFLEGGEGGGGAGRATPTHTCNERNHKRRLEGHSQPKLQVTVKTWKEANASAQACR